MAVQVWYDVGSRHEPKGGTGFAHLFEHLMFQGSANVGPGEHFAAIQGVGGTFNGTTSFDRTNYFETVPVHALELALWLEADRMATLLEAVTQDNLDNQRDVVKNERRQRFDNQPYGTAWERVFALLYPAGHPYHHLPIGSMEDLDAASVEDIHEFFRRFYGPDNAVIAVVGDVDPDSTVALVDQYFAGISASGQDTTAPDGTIGPLDAPEHVVIDEVVPNSALYHAYRVPPDGTADADALEVAFEVLTGGGASRLVERFVRGEQLARSLGGGPQGLVGGTSVAALITHLRAGTETDRIVSGIDDEIARLAQHGPADDELERARARLERHWLAQVETVMGRAGQLCQYEVLHGGAAHLLEVLPRLQAVTGDEVMAAVARWLVPDNRVTVEYRPEAVA